MYLECKNFAKTKKIAFEGGDQMYLKCKKFAKTKNGIRKKSAAVQAQPADALKHMTDYPRTNSINMLPWATVFLPVHKYSVSRTWTGKGKVHAC